MLELNLCNTQKIERVLQSKYKEQKDEIKEADELKSIVKRLERSMKLKQSHIDNEQLKLKNMKSIVPKRRNNESHFVLS